jgi:1,4-dihydroxy-2-naphthoyl-CoA hydrolase
MRPWDRRRLAASRRGLRRPPGREPAAAGARPERVAAFDDHYGLELVESSPVLVRASVAVRPELLQPTGVVHGGVYAAIAEGVASLGTNVAVHAQGAFALGMSNATSFLRPVADGAIHVTARRRHLGRTTSVWDVEMADDGSRVCAVSRVTLAIRPR